MGDLYVQCACGAEIRVGGDGRCPVCGLVSAVARAGPPPRSEPLPPATPSAVLLEDAVDAWAQRAVGRLRVVEVLLGILLGMVGLVMIPSAPPMHVAMGVVLALSGVANLILAWRLVPGNPGIVPVHGVLSLLGLLAGAGAVITVVVELAMNYDVDRFFFDQRFGAHHPVPPLAGWFLLPILVVPLYAWRTLMSPAVQRLLGVPPREGVAPEMDPVGATEDRIFRRGWKVLMGVFAGGLFWTLVLAVVGLIGATVDKAVHEIQCIDIPLPVG